MKLKKLERVDYLVVHCSATPRTATAIQARDIDAWHRRRGWLKIGYHFVIKRDGTIERGRELDEVGSHVQGFNSRSIGICMIGGGDNIPNSVHNFEVRQFSSLELILRDLKRRHPNAEVLGHRDLSPDKDQDGVIESHEWLKTCPTFDVRKWSASVGLK